MSIMAIQIRVRRTFTIGLSHNSKLRGVGYRQNNLGHSAVPRNQEFFLLNNCFYPSEKTLANSLTKCKTPG